MWCGATTPSSARVVAKVDAGSQASLWLADNAGFSDAIQIDTADLSSDDIAHLTATGLDASTRYWYRVEDGDGVDGTTGTFRTHPPLGGPADFTVWMATCAGSNTAYPSDVVGPLMADRVSNHPAFDSIRQQALSGEFLLGIHAGDLHYYDLGRDPGRGSIPDGAAGATPYWYRRAYDELLQQPRQQALYSQVPLAYVWDDHDYGPNNSDRTAPGRESAAQVYRERVPHYPLPATGPIFQSFQIARTLFVLLDVRYDRSPNSDPDGPDKTMLGSAQKAWLDQLLASSQAEFLVLVTASQWLGTTEDTWGNFAHEQGELLQMLGDHRWLHRMCGLGGDNHNMGICSGAHNPRGRFPYGQFAPIDSGGSRGTAERWDVGHTNERRGLWGTLRVRDTGSAIMPTLSAWSYT